MAWSAERERTITVVSIVVTLVVVGAYLTFSDSALGIRLRALAGIDDRLAPAVEATTTGSYAFFNTQRNGEPVGFSPCREIRYVVNPDYAPPSWETYVQESVAEVERLTGLVFEYEGTTDDRDFRERLRGSDPLPVLIGWSDEDEVGSLADDVAGIGGPTMMTVGTLKTYVTGAVVLDREVTDRLAQSRDADRQQVALLLHELGHLVGLDHVDDPGELMNPTAGGRYDFGPGDRAGLAELGNISCS